GLALGSALGGALSDLREPRRVAAALLLLAAPAVAALPSVDALVPGLLAGWALLPRALVGTAASCLPAAVLLGGVGPAAAKEALLVARAAPGRALGRVAAAGALGRVLGTFATGFLLVPGLAASVALAAVAAG